LIFEVENLHGLCYSLVVEKKKAHYDLLKVQHLIAEGKYEATKTALRSAANDFGLTKEWELGACVQNLSAKHFYKSMTTRIDSRVWQDVYRMTVKGADAYIKVQILNDGTVIISFKKWETEWL